jgi:hypothetical protein
MVKYYGYIQLIRQDKREMFEIHVVAPGNGGVVSFLFRGHPDDLRKSNFLFNEYGLVLSVANILPTIIEAEKAWFDNMWEIAK